MMKFALTTIAWLETLARKEIEKQGWKNIEVKDRIIFFEWWEELISKVNLWSRIGNKLYLIAWAAKKVDTFDSLFNLVSSIVWKKYITENFPIVVNAKSIRSTLTSLPTIQAVSKKAVVSTLIWNKDTFLKEDEDLQKFDILTLFLEDDCYIMINTSWEALHKRWYRRQAWEAPIKENLAAAMVLLSDWRFKEPFYDPFCWSGTLAIEALMIAKNMAPWLHRKFAFEKWDFLDSNILKVQKEEAKSKIYEGDYKIYASDKDEEMIEIAKSNAKNIGLEKEILFEEKDFYDFSEGNITWWVVSNPPYGKRLEEDNIEKLYKTINDFYKKNKDVFGGIITSYEEFQYVADKQVFKNRKLYNGNELCYFYYKNWNLTR